MDMRSQRAVIVSGGCGGGTLELRLGRAVPESPAFGQRTSRIRGLAARVALVACVAASGIPASAEMLTLNDAVAMAIQHNRGLQNAALDASKAEDRVKATRTRQYPNFSLYALGAQQLRSLDFTLEKGVLGEYASTGPLPSQDVHIKSPMEPTGMMMAKVSQPLTGLIKIRRNLDSLKTGVELAKEQTRAEQQKVVRQVKEVYYSLQQVESSLRSVRQTVALYRELERLTENYVAGAVVLKSDLLEVQSGLAKATQNEIVLQDQMATGKEQLNQLLGRDILTEFEVQPILEASGDQVDLVVARERALRQRPEVKQSQLRKKQAEQDLRTKSAEYLPEVSAEFNNVTLMNYGKFLPQQNTSIGVSLSWEPFDWGRKKHELAEKRRSIQQADNSEEDAVSSVIADVNARFRQLRQCRAQLQVARLTQDAAMESLRVVKNKYAVQAVLMKDVLQGQVNLEQSNTEYQQALLSFWNARADFERAMGEEL